MFATSVIPTQLIPVLTGRAESDREIARAVAVEDSVDQATESRPSTCRALHVGPTRASMFAPGTRLLSLRSEVLSRASALVQSGPKAGAQLASDRSWARGRYRAPAWAH